MVILAEYSDNATGSHFCLVFIGEKFFDVILRGLYNGSSVFVGS